MLRKIISTNIHFLVFFVVVFAFLTSLYQREAGIDEAIIASHSYTLKVDGFVKSILFNGYIEGPNAWEVRQYTFHKLFVLMGTFFMSLFGFGITTFKSVSLFYTIVFYIVLYFYLKKFSNLFSIPLYCYAGSLLLLNNCFFEHAYTFRPELMCLTLGFISFYFIEKGLKEKLILPFFLSGIFAGLATATHLNGLIYSLAGFFLLIIKREFKFCFYFSIAVGLSTMVYFFDIHSIKDLNALWFQFHSDPNITDKEPFYIGILTEHKRLFWSARELTFSFLLFLSLVFGFKYFKKNQSNLLIYLLLLYIFLGMLGHGKTVNYALHYIPYIVIIISSFYVNILENVLWKRLFALLILILFVVVHCFYNFSIIRTKLDISKHNAAIAQKIGEKHSKVSAASVFVFNQIDQFTITGDVSWHYHYFSFHPNEKRSFTNFLQFSKKNKDKFIILDKRTNTRDVLAEAFKMQLSVNDTILDYKVHYSSDSLIILKLK